jgi:hypothetical protein
VLYNFETMVRALKFGGFVVIHVIIAVIGTAVLDTALRRTIPHSMAATLWKECILSIICAAGIGFSVWRIWQNSAAKWTWVLPAAWFAVGLVATGGREHVLGRLVGFGNFGAPEMRSFFAFTVPLIRAVFYSLGACISSLLQPATLAFRP